MNTSTKAPARYRGYNPDYKRPTKLFGTRATPQPRVHGDCLLCGQPVPWTDGVYRPQVGEGILHLACWRAHKAHKAPRP